MENAVDALKIAFSIFVFLIALSLTIMLVGQARMTADIIFHYNDKTEFYEYVTEDTVSNDNRIVGISSIIPTIHRYAKEQYAVTIFDTEGNMIVRYDLWTEGFMPNWNRIVKNYHRINGDAGDKQTYEEIRDRLQSIQNLVNPAKTVDVENVITKLYSVTSSTNSSIKVGAPWVGDNAKILSRITADMLGTNYTLNAITYKGKDLKNYENSKFVEKFLEITTSGQTVTDDGYSLETIKGNKKLEIIYILQN